MIFRGSGSQLDRRLDLKRGQLVIVGTGIASISQATNESVSEMKGADIVLYLVSDPLTVHWIRTLNDNSESLSRFYSHGKLRITTYNQITDYILAKVREGLQVCAAFYGHPGIFVHSAHSSIERARSEGYTAIMKPGVSSIDCLFADLGIDPFKSGCQILEASDFLIFDRQIDPAGVLVLLQCGLVGDLGPFQSEEHENRKRILGEALAEVYGSEHEVIVYEASQYNICQPRVEQTTIAQLATTFLGPLTTLCAPPAKRRKPNKQRLKALRINPRQLLAQAKEDRNEYSSF